MEESKVYLYWALLMGLTLLILAFGQPAIIMLTILISSLYGLYKVWPRIKKQDWLGLLSS